MFVAKMLFTYIYTVPSGHKRLGLEGPLVQLNYSLLQATVLCTER